MGIENRLADRPSLEQGEAQQHRISGALPDSEMDIGTAGDLPYQHGIDRHADHHEKALQSQSHKAAQIVVAHLSPLPVDHGSKGNRTDRTVDINFYHPPYQYDHHAEGQNGHRDFQQQCLHQQAEQFSQLHGLQLRGYIAQNGGEIYAGGAGYDTGALLHHILRQFKYRHSDVKGMGDKVHRNKRFQYPLINGEGFKVQCILSSRFFK